MTKTKVSKRKYAIYDVFTHEALSGNPLAVVFDSDGLSDDDMQNIAAEFNLSETVFISDAENKAHTAKLRIFMPRGELPFAGHPTVGATVAICEAQNTDVSRILMLEENVGVIRSAYSKKQVGYGEFDLPKLPAREVPMLEKDMVAAALGIATEDIGFENHLISQFSAGVPYLCVPVKNLAVMERLVFNESRWLSYFPSLTPLEVHCPYVYCRETVNHDASLHARMFAPHHGIAEDPATGSAAAALSGALFYFDNPLDGAHEYLIEQGVEMGRASFIRLEIECQNGIMNSARIGGHAVKVAEGTLLI